MIASDDNNHHFVGAHDPDARLAVRFYTKVLPNPFESEKQGRPIFFETDFVSIKLPGNQLNDFDGYVNDTHKQRFPRQWAFYQNNKNADHQMIGTPIEQWPLIGKAVAEELRGVKFYTVDQIANASDQQLQAIGMRAGMQPHTFREKAQQWLKRAGDDAAAQKAEQEAADLRAKLADTDVAMAEMRAQMAELMANQKAKPGPKPKVEAEA